MSTSKLILIRGDGHEGKVFELQKGQTRLGRTEGELLFSQDRSISPHHCTFIQRGSQMLVRDEASVNGVYKRLTEPVPLEEGQHFLCGEQVLKVEYERPRAVAIGVDGAVFGGTDAPLWQYRLIQVLEGDIQGRALCVSTPSLLIGRQDSDFDFPDDPFISYRHARIEWRHNKAYLVDLESRNGTFLRIAGETDLRSGDQLFIGKQLLSFQAS